MEILHFRERYLKPYAEPVSPAELRVGEVYFSVQYTHDDRDGYFPIIETLVFIGIDLDKDDTGRVYFQDIESHRAGITYDTSSKDDGAVFYAQEEKHLNHIFEYENALNELLKCSLRRQKLGR